MLIFVSIVAAVAALFFFSWLLTENALQSRQRKMVYAVTVLILLVPIIFLGAPTSEDVIPGTDTSVSGGVLAQMRVEHDLGESKLGQIDPSSAAMSLVLLGLRGPAASVLHLKAIEYQERKDWSKLKTTVDSIIKLQPHYIEIWKFQGWNLAFNVSREWDQVKDRFFWVKEGIKFLQLGTRRNETSTALFHNVGDFMGRKFGNSDEKKFFRKFFISDPDEKAFANKSADPEINPGNKDNYLVAYDWFVLTNEKDRLYRIKKMTHVIARQGPARALYDYASARQNEGAFGATNRKDWENAHKEWTENYGNDVFLGLDDIRYKLECSDEELRSMAEENDVVLTRQRKVWEQNIKMVNYTFWKDLANCEREQATADAHEAIYKGKVAYSQAETFDSEDGTPSKAEEHIMRGITLLAKVFEDHPEVATHDGFIEEGLLAVLYLEKLHQNNSKPTSSEHPLMWLVKKESGRIPEIQQDFLLEQRTGFDAFGVDADAPQSPETSTDKEPAQSESDSADSE